jgi:hypothetical protein
LHTRGTLLKIMAQQRVLGYENPGFAHDADYAPSRYRVRREIERKTEIRWVFDKKQGIWIKRRFQIFPARFRRKYDKDTGRTTLTLLQPEAKPIKMRPAAMRARKKSTRVKSRTI